MSDDQMRAAVWIGTFQTALAAAANMSAQGRSLKVGEWKPDESPEAWATRIADAALTRWEMIYFSVPPAAPSITDDIPF